MARNPARTRPAPGKDPDRSAIDERRARSLEEPLGVRLRSSRPYPLLEVRNPLHGTAYYVMLPEFPARASALCTCTDFARRGLGTCKHIEAGYRWLSGHPDARPLRPAPPDRTQASRVWREVERRLRAPRDPAESLGRRRRWVGAALYEKSPVARA